MTKHLARTLKVMQRRGVGVGGGVGWLGILTARAYTEEMGCPLSNLTWEAVAGRLLGHKNQACFKLSQKLR